MPMTGVMPLPAVTNSTLAGRDGRQHEVAGGLVEVHERADARAAHEVAAHDAVGHGLDGDRDAAVGAVGGPR